MLVALTPSFYTIYTNSKYELEKTVSEHTIELVDHSIKIKGLEENRDKVLMKLDEIQATNTSILVELQNKKNRD